MPSNALQDRRLTKEYRKAVGEENGHQAPFQTCRVMLCRDLVLQKQCWGSGTGSAFFLGLPDPDPLVRSTDSDPAQDPSLFLSMC
jgi:hypothetical protein